MLKGLQYNAPRADDDLLKGRPARKIHAEDYWISEVSYNPGKLTPGAARSRCANQHVFLAGIAMQERLKQRNQQSVESGVVVDGRGLQLTDEFSIEYGELYRAFVCLYRRSRKVGGQIQAGQIAL